MFVWSEVIVLTIVSESFSIGLVKLAEASVMISFFATSIAELIALTDQYKILDKPTTVEIMTLV